MTPAPSDTSDDESRDEHNNGGNDNDTDDGPPNDSGPHSGEPGDSGSGDSGLDGGGLDGGGLDGGGLDGGGPNNRPPASDGQPTRPARAGVGAVVELRVRLSTLLGLDQYPGEVARWGPVHAELARDLTATLGGAQWRFALTDEHGHLTHSGTTRARPTTSATRSAACRAMHRAT